jgi:hypothetical protein
MVIDQQLMGQQVSHQPSQHIINGQAVNRPLTSQAAFMYPQLTDMQQSPIGGPQQWPQSQAPYPIQPQAYPAIGRPQSQAPYQSQPPTYPAITRTQSHPPFSMQPPQQWPIQDPTQHIVDRPPSNQPRSQWPTDEELELNMLNPDYNPVTPARINEIPYQHSISNNGMIMYLPHRPIA